MPYFHTGQTDRLEFEDFGPPTGFPILVQHGMVASIHERELFHTLVASGRRVLSIARPGYDGSSEVEMATIGAWGALVRGLIDELGLGSFSVLGISSGAPYSYAIAHALPDRTREVFILSGTPDLTDPRVARLWPFPLNTDSSLDDLKTLARDLFAVGPHESFGIALDLKLRVQDWGFRLEDLKTRVRMQHSRGDLNVPLETALLTQRKLAGSTMTVVESDEHFSPALLEAFWKDVGS